MILKSLRLENIRSYVQQTILFPQGRVLLAGDIGSGKSTILHAIEFALFGLGDLDSASLLRHGATIGSVELSFEINQQVITVYRQLRRGKMSISQDTAWSIINNEKQSLMPTELKARMITLLGYPKEFLSKSKNPVYRYTVYTPQEEMKAILYAKTDERLSILRQLFGIDKYQRIRDNVATYARYIRDQSKELQGRTADLDQKQRTLEKYKNELVLAEAELQKNSEKLAQVKLRVTQQKQHWTAIEKQCVELNMLKQEHTRIESELRYKKDFLEKHQQERDRTESSHQILMKELQQLPLLNKEQIIQVYKEKEAVIKEQEQKRTGAQSVMTKIRTTQEHKEHLLQSIQALNTCPVCKQKVGEEHKKTLAHEENLSLELLKKQAEHAQHEQAIAQQALETCTRELQQLRAQEQQAIMVSFKQQQLKENQEHNQRMISDIARTQELIMKLEQQLQKIIAHIELNSVTEQTLASIKISYESVLAEERNVEVGFAISQQRAQHVSVLIVQIMQEVQEKERFLSLFQHLQKLQHWLETLFCPLMETMEKQVFMRVWRDFNTLFTQWFSMLIQDSMLTAELDQTFTPVFRQNGYETQTDFLSGGERTAAALSYRLALNKIINDLLHSIQTKDILVLDEPTDGFSDEQLDRVRDVLDQLQLAQILLVSHERKIEGFVQHIIRVHKEGHVSRVAEKIL